MHYDKSVNNFSQKESEWVMVMAEKNMDDADYRKYVALWCRYYLWRHGGATLPKQAFLRQMQEVAGSAEAYVRERKRDDGGSERGDGDKSGV